jgi:XTP/dITP diphosphohydrolase
MIQGVDMRTIVLASNNKHKIEEFRQMLNTNIVTMEEIGFKDDIIEDGKTFFENSMIKAKAISNYLKNIGLDYDVLADDSGLCVNALDGEPGIFSARYAGDHDTEANKKKLLDNLKNKDDRSAYFNCTLVLLKPDGSYIEAVGKTFGHILKEKDGESEMCYDCLFFSDELGKSFSSATKEEKNSVSHRGKAIQNLIEKLKNN